LTRCLAISGLGWGGRELGQARRAECRIAELLPADLLLMLSWIRACAVWGAGPVVCAGQREPRRGLGLCPVVVAVEQGVMAREPVC